MSDTTEGGSAGKPGPIDPKLYDRDDVRRVLPALDIGALYRVFQDAGSVNVGSPS